MADIIDPKVKAAAEYLRSEFMRWSQEIMQREGRIPTQNEYSRWLGVPPTSMSAWINGFRLPTQDNADSICVRLGPKIYDICGYTPRMPNDKWLHLVAERWALLTPQRQREIAEMVDNDTFDKVEKRGKKTANQAAQ